MFLTPLVSLVLLAWSAPGVVPPPQSMPASIAEQGEVSLRSQIPLAVQPASHCVEKCERFVDPENGNHLGYGCVVGTWGKDCVATVSYCQITTTNCGLPPDDPEGSPQPIQISTSDGQILSQILTCVDGQVALREERVGYMFERQWTALSSRAGTYTVVTSREHY